MDNAREAVAKWMIENSYATGHGDTLDDLLRELVLHARDRGVNACLDVCDRYEDNSGRYIAGLIRELNTKVR